MVRKLSMLVAGVAVASLFGGVQGCTCSPATVDTVQPNAVSKAVFDPSREWYLRTTIIDVPYGTGAGFIGGQSGLERVRFKIDEDTLWAYRSYEHVTNTDAPAANLDVDGDGTPDNLYFGAPVAGFPIEKHFDIRRSYNHSTGEEGPVVEENTEKPWYERAYMRVDWSRNVLASLRTGGLEYSVTTYETNPNGEDAPTFDCPDYNCTDDAGGPDDQINYIDLVQRATVAPSARYYPGYGAIPICYFYGSAQFDCAPATLKVRYSILAVDENREYEPLAYDDRWMETFGYFETMRLNYNREYGLTETDRVWFANHHNIWGEWFAKDEAGNVLLDADGKPLPMPYTNRPIRKIVYHLNPGYPADLLQVTREMVANWNEPFRDTVNDLRFWECMGETNDDVDTCTSRMDPNLDVYVLCANNPALPTDPDECKTPEYGARIGDLRFSHIWLVDKPQLASPFGYGPSAADPTSGEIISANAFVYGAVLDTYSTSAADIVALMNGDISTEDFIAGSNVAAWVNAVNGGNASDLVGHTAGDGGSSKTYAPGSVASMRDKMNLDWMGGGGTALVDASSPEALEATVAARLADAANTGILGPGAGVEDQVLDFIKEEGLDAPLWNEETILAAGFDPTVPYSADLFSGVSPMDTMDPNVQAELEADKTFAAMNSIDLEEFVDPAILGLAMSFKNNGASWEDVREQLKVAIYRGVMEHEIGHTMGLRHNFEASFDAFNYFPEYWDLRDDGNMGPRHIDPETPAEIAGRIREYEYSSVMDYHSRFNMDTKGIGSYDRAAIKFGYGMMVEVMPNVPAGNFPGVTLPLNELVGLIGAYNEVSAPAPIIGLNNGTYISIHYTDYPGLFGDLNDRVDVPFNLLHPYDATVAASVANGDRNQDFTDLLVMSRNVIGIGGEGAPAVPYRFCGDEFASGSIGCARYDAGADPVEVHRSYFEGYWEYYLLSNFRRDRYGFSVPGYIGRVYSRTFDPLDGWMRYYVLWNYILQTNTNPGAAEFFANDHGFGPFTVAIEEGFRFLEQVIHQPEPGTYVNLTTAYGDPYFGLASYTPGLDYTGYEERSIELGAGKFYASTWDFDAGYYWFDKLTRVGSFYDKWMAVRTLATASSSYGFIGRETAVDSRAYTIGYNRLYRDQISRIFGSLMSEDPVAYSPVMASGTLLYPDPTRVDEMWPPAGMTGEPIQSGAYWNIRYLATLYGMAYFPLSFDNQFLDASRIYVEGTGNTVTAPPGQEVVNFTDPISGKTYIAWSYPARSKTGEILLDDGGNVIELGGAARVLRKANTILGFYNLTAAHPSFDITTTDGAAAQVTFADQQLRYMADEIERYMNMYELFEGRF
ncbi:MAG TPA: zinc-dependent metalloprotease [Myxococcota bacterium]|nr:zinc-dependent metalloprotease [Myxococcota bacterium]